MRIVVSKGLCLPATCKKNIVIFNDARHQYKNLLHLCLDPAESNTFALTHLLRVNLNFQAMYRMCVINAHQIQLDWMPYIALGLSVELLTKGDLLSRMDRYYLVCFY